MRVYINDAAGRAADAAHPDWRLEVASEAHRFRTEHGEIPSAGELAQWYYDKTDWQPDESDIRELLRFLIGKK